MSAPFVLTCLWLVAANVLAMLPSRDRHWRRAYGLICVGVPLLGWLTVEEGPVWGLLALAAGASVLRWPVILGWRWLRGTQARRPAEPAEQVGWAESWAVTVPALLIPGVLAGLWARGANFAVALLVLLPGPLLLVVAHAAWAARGAPPGVAWAFWAATLPGAASAMLGGLVGLAGNREG